MKLKELIEADIPTTYSYNGKPKTEKQMIAILKRGGTLMNLYYEGLVPTEQMQLTAIEYGDKYEISIIIDILNIHNQVPSEQVQLAAVKRYGENILSLNNPSNQVITAALTSQSFILRNRLGIRPYDEFVKKQFKGNQLLMNKWLRYAKNVREQL